MAAKIEKPFSKGRVISDRAAVDLLNAQMRRVGLEESEWGVPYGTFSHIRAGRQGLHPKVAERLGLRKVTAYEVVDEKRFKAAGG